MLHLDPVEEIPTRGRPMSNSVAINGRKQKIAIVTCVIVIMSVEKSSLSLALNLFRISRMQNIVFFYRLRKTSSCVGFFIDFNNKNISQYAELALGLFPRPVTIVFSQWQLKEF